MDCGFKSRHGYQGKGMKYCSKCGTTKPYDQYHFKDRANGIYQSQCVECRKEYLAQHYQNNKDMYKKHANSNRSQYRERNRQHILEHLRTHPCVDCGETDIEVLQFDHVEMIGSKSRRIGKYIGGSSLSTLIKEIAKCEIRCANCHYRRTRKQMGWDRSI